MAKPVERPAGQGTFAAGADPLGVGRDQGVEPVRGGAGGPGIGVRVEASLAGDDQAVLDPHGVSYLGARGGFGQQRQQRAAVHRAGEVEQRQGTGAGFEPTIACLPCLHGIIMYYIKHILVISEYDLRFKLGAGQI